MARSLARLSGRRRAVSALGAGVLAASLALAGCSSSSPKGGGTIPPLNTAGASSGSAASTSASGGASTGASGAASAGAVTAESLSDPDLGYTVVSVPDGLDATQTKVLQDFIAYDKATWRIWFGGGKDTTGIDKVATGSTLQHVIDNAAKMKADGRRAQPPVRVSVSDVYVDGGGVSAQVAICVDQRKMSMLDDKGNDVTTQADRGQVPLATRMVHPGNNSWLAAEEQQGQDGECSVD
ncbi:hypothetical protein BKH15_06905 [Actinomyces oris]|uniref:Lipoprotein n=1 Tax=Actinomyces oris TaxID=544580 RepID=A0A1Q8X9D2_9ACTO|nr:hypothetical protein BKH15_06905 [Actinomyces oris]